MIVRDATPTLKTVARFALIAACLVSVWYVADAPTNSQLIEGYVVSSFSFLSRYGYADTKTIVQLDDGTTISYLSVGVLATGSKVSCVRAQRRFSGLVYYKC